MRRPSAPTVISLIALFVALGGTSYAVVKLPPASVGNRELKRNAVTGAKIRNGSVGPKDLSARVFGGGTRGPRGSQGPAGPAGPPAANAEAWKPLAFIASWKNYGGEWATGQYRKDAAGRVYLRGLVVKGTGAPTGDETIAVLPAGYAPSARISFAVMMGADTMSPGRVDVLANGEVRWYAGPPGEGDYTSLETISFWAD